MPRIRILTSVAGPRFAWQADDVVEASVAEATRFIKAGLALPVRDAVPERAVVTAPETAQRRAPRVRRSVRP